MYAIRSYYVIPADATSLTDLEMLFAKSMEHFGGKIDFVLHSIGMSLNVRKDRPYDDLDYSFLMKTMDISAFSFHKMLQTAKKLDALNEWGSVVGLSYIAAQRTLFRYNDIRITSYNVCYTKLLRAPKHALPMARLLKVLLREA